MSTAEGKQTNHHHNVSKPRQKSSKKSENHELTAKESLEENNKKPFLKKRSGLFRFYKCMPSAIVSTSGGGSSKGVKSGSSKRQNSAGHHNFDPCTAFVKSSMNSTKSQQQKQQQQNQGNRAGNNNQHCQYQRRNDSSECHRSGTYETGLELIKCLKYKPEPDGVSVGFSEKNDKNTKIPCRISGHGGHYDHGGDAHAALMDFRALERIEKAAAALHDKPNHPGNPGSPQKTEACAKMSPRLRNCLLWPSGNDSGNFSNICDDSKDSARRGSILSDDFIEEIIEDEVAQDEEDNNSEDEVISLEDELSRGSSSCENCNQSKDYGAKPRNIKPDLTNQLAQLQNELMTMKSKVSSLERNLEDKSSIKTKNKLDPSKILNTRRAADHRKTSKSISIENIQSALEKIGTQLTEIQNGFIQKLETLEEEMHLKSQRWCENQIQLADKVHSLFSELEIVSNRVKSQQHQVQNLAENVEKEFENLKTEWKESTKSLEKRLELLEQENSTLANKLDSVTSAQQMVGDTAIVRSAQEDDEVKADMSSPRIQGPEPNTVQPVPSSNNSASVLKQDRRLDGFQSSAGDSQPQIECVGGQIVSARKTLQNGDIETVYTNGTREIIKADKSEIKHVYRNGDVRTVSPDGTITYFYAESSTWQTTFPTGVEFFKFPNGVTERRLPNGLIEQTDVNGRVTFFQAAPAKPLQNVPPPPLVSPPVPQKSFEIPRSGQLQFHTHHHPYPPVLPIRTGSGPVLTQQKIPKNPSQLKLAPGERIIVFENGEEEIHGPDYRKRIFPDGTIKTVYQDGSQETRYPNGRIRIKDGSGNLVADVTVDNTNNKMIVPLKTEKISTAHSSQDNNNNEQKS